MSKSNELLKSLEDKVVRVTRRIVYEGPAKKIHEVLNVPMAFMHEDKKNMSYITMEEKPRVVAVYDDDLGDFMPVAEQVRQEEKRPCDKPVLCDKCGTTSPLDIATNGWCIRCKYGDKPYH